MHYINHPSCDCCVQNSVVRRYAHVAQLVEHVLGKDEVTGSIPVMGSAAMKPRAGTSTAGSNPANPRGSTPEQGEQRYGERGI